MANTTQDTVNQLQALLAFLRALGYDVDTITLTESIELLTRFTADINEVLNVAP